MTFARWAARAAALVLGAAAAALALVVRLDTTWGDRPFDLEEALWLGLAAALVALAVWAWGSPLGGRIALVIVALLLVGLGVREFFADSSVPTTELELVAPVSR